ncbi:MAG: hypothetical protein M3303_15395 [Gemmatimonadota bacterium]|nr:hypothetical protein [Gemmatimonadota bacterium]
MVLLFGLSGCADRDPTSPGITAAGATAQLQQGADRGLTLHPSGFGEKSYAAWKAKEGQQDSEGNGDHALYFQKMVPTPTFAAGIAVIEGVEGLAVSEITGLSWEHRADGHCGAGAPRWNLGVNAPDGRTFTVFLGCAAAAKSPGGTDDAGRVWIRDSYPGVAIGSAVLALTGQTDLTGLTVRNLVIVFDEGNDLGFPGYVHLDNITVSVNATPHVFTGPMDNGR